MRRIKIKVYGRVQGVFFRKNAYMVAEELGIKGWVRNEKDGSVDMEAEGENDALDQFLKWCLVGPKRAKVLKVEYEDLPGLKKYSGFQILRP